MSAPHRDPVWGVYDFWVPRTWAADLARLGLPLPPKHYLDQCVPAWYSRVVTVAERGGWEPWLREAVGAGGDAFVLAMRAAFELGGVPAVCALVEGASR